MPKLCLKPGCRYNQFGGGYCKSHQWMRKDKKPKRQQPYSKKRQKLNRKYNPLAEKFREENPDCAIRSPVCTGRTEGVHHKKGRGKYLMAIETFLPACNACNGYVEDHSNWAYENGFKESKFTPTKSQKNGPTND